MEIGGNSKTQDKDTTRASASASGTINAKSVAPNLPTSNVGDQNQAPPQDIRREMDLYMPMTNIVRVLLRGLPPHAKIPDDAKEIIQECVSEFISIVTSEANEKAHREYRKTIHPEDVIAAMSSLAFDDYVEPLTFCLNKYRTKDPERGASMQIQLPMAVRSGAQQPPAAVDEDELVGPDEYNGFDEVIRKYFLND